MRVVEVGWRGGDQGGDRGAGRKEEERGRI
jgi:hypothetical protein